MAGASNIVVLSRDTFLERAFSMATTTVLITSMLDGPIVYMVVDWKDNTLTPSFYMLVYNALVCTGS
jgi:hypothetical protein